MPTSRRDGRLRRGSTTPRVTTRTSTPTPDASRALARLRCRANRGARRIRGGELGTPTSCIRSSAGIRWRWLTTAVSAAPRTREAPRPVEQAVAGDGHCCALCASNRRAGPGPPCARYPRRRSSWRAPTGPPTALLSAPPQTACANSAAIRLATWVGVVVAGAACQNRIATGTRHQPLRGATSSRCQRSQSPQRCDVNGRARRIVTSCPTVVVFGRPPALARDGSTRRQPSSTPAVADPPVQRTQPEREESRPHRHQDRRLTPPNHARRQPLRHLLVATATTKGTRP
jgi:hypothetical protein